MPSCVLLHGLELWNEDTGTEELKPLTGGRGSSALINGSPVARALALAQSNKRRLAIDEDQMFRAFVNGEMLRVLLTAHCVPCPTGHYYS